MDAMELFRVYEESQVDKEMLVKRFGLEVK